MSLVDPLQYISRSSLYIDFIFSLKSQIGDTEGLGGKLSEDDKDTILSAIKEKTEWLDEHPQADAEDYEEQLSELQATVAVSVILLFDIFFVANQSLSLSLPTCMVVPVVHLTMTSRCLSATTSFKAGMETNKSKIAWHWRLPVIVDDASSQIQSEKLYLHFSFQFLMVFLV